MEQQGFTHFDEYGNAIMADISKKAVTERKAVAAGRITMSQECYDAVKGGTIKKGDVLGTARLAGIMGAKQTSGLIPLCHMLSIEQASVDFDFDDDGRSILAKCSITVTDKTGAEMEALTGVTIALLTVYDMCKSIDKSMTIGEICLLTKQGGKSGEYKRGLDPPTKVCAANLGHPLRKGDCDTTLCERFNWCRNTV